MNRRTVRVLGAIVGGGLLVMGAATTCWAQNPPALAVTAPTAPPSPWTPPGYPTPPPGYVYVPLPSLRLAKPQPPAYLRYTEGQPIPEGYHLRSDIPRGAIVAGGLVGGISYGLGALVGLSSTKNAKGFLFVPILGPWLTLGFRSYGRWDSNEWRGLGELMAVLLLIEDGLLQAVGFGAVVSGVLDKHKTLVRNRSSWSVSPSPMGTGYGLSAVGEF